MTYIRAAIYARVSSEQQATDSTISASRSSIGSSRANSKRVWPASDQSARFDAAMLRVWFPCSCFTIVLLIS